MLTLTFHANPNFHVNLNFLHANPNFFRLNLIFFMLTLIFFHANPSMVKRSVSQRHPAL